KQLLVGGLENIFEMGKDFRNESISSEFHPEFTAIELYQNYANYIDILNLVKGMLNHLNSTIGEPSSKPTQAEEVKLYDFILENTKLDARTCDLSKIKSNISPNRLKDYGKHPEFRGLYIYDLFLSLLDNFSDRNVILHGVPKEVSVLGKSFDDEPSLVEEFRYFVKGRSFCYGVTELTDPQEQKERLEAQARYLEKSTEDNDNSFLDILNFGLPPCAGLGLGLERLLMIYTQQENIKDVIYFPL
ncbi:MAG: amino acid--tRNA ligase-related protein, partial [Nanoarchaeota archaeon]